MYLSALFTVQNLKKIFGVDPELKGCTFFGPKMAHLPQMRIFQKNINIILMNLLTPFIVQNFKKILRADQSYEDASFLRPKMAHLL